jgi:hypothetical protein
MTLAGELTERLQWIIADGLLPKHRVDPHLQEAGERTAIMAASRRPARGSA